MTKATDRRRAFTLTEIAIVLGVIGLVLAGLWVAYSAVSERRKINEAISDIRFIMNRVQSLAATNMNAFKFPNGNNIGCNQKFTTSGLDPNTGLPISGFIPSTYYASQATQLVTSAAAQAGIFPQSMLAGGTASGYANPLSPWSTGSGSSVQLTLVTNTDACSATSGHAAQVFGQPANPSVNVLSNFNTRITFQDSVPSSGCIQLLMSDAAELVANGLTGVGTGTRLSGFSNGFYQITPANYKTTMSFDNIQKWCTANGTLDTIQMNLEFAYPPAHE